MGSRIAVLVCACLAGRAPADDGPDAVRGANRFALEAYARLAEEPGDVVFSPFSISTALGMTYAGARGETARQMDAVLHFGPDPHRSLGGLAAALEKAEGCELRVANALFAQRGEAFLPAFTALVEKEYKAPLHRVDFGATEAARRTINGWVETRTNDKIRELIPKRILRGNTVLVLVNALYFRGAWAHPFSERATTDLPFHLADGTKAPVPTMRKTETFRYAETDGLKTLELPYRGGRIAMVVAVPEGDLDPARLATALEDLRPRAVSVFLPKFRVESTFRLNDMLTEMGMPAAFGGGADFSGMNGRRDLFIQHVLHKAFVDVNERGTEAAAATAVVMGRKGRPQKPVEFRADRPFVVMIRDRESGAVLFMGRVSDPR